MEGMGFRKASIGLSVSSACAGSMALVWIVFVGCGDKIFNDDVWPVRARQQDIWLPGYFV